MNPLLLDTHVWLWFAEGISERLPARSVRVIDKARRESGLLVSAVSVWELGMQIAKGRVQLSAPLNIWVQRAVNAPGIRLVPVDGDIAVESTMLPGTPHGDPADRFLIATARVLNATIATRDEEILEYGGSGLLRTIRV
jgi:PIN domain nuclease of toxin-antitoxin system